ncbi:MAG: hypothetical protein LBP80_00820, partial [Treponema sp.]|nr:hypothetical protein [Treponema sp.]
MAFIRKGRSAKIAESEDAVSEIQAYKAPESGSDENMLSFDSEDAGEAADRPAPRVMVRTRARRVTARQDSGALNAAVSDPDDAGFSAPIDEPVRTGPGRPRGRRPYDRNEANYGGNGAEAAGDSASAFTGARPSAVSASRVQTGGNGIGGGNGYAPAQAADAAPQSPLAIPRLPSMPDIYGKPEPRSDQDNSKPRLSINELIRLNMMDLRE